MKQSEQKRTKKKYHLFKNLIRLFVDISIFIFIIDLFVVLTNLGKPYLVELPGVLIGGWIIGGFLLVVILTLKVWGITNKLFNESFK